MKPESLAKHLAFQPLGIRDVDLCRVCGEHASAHARPDATKCSHNALGVYCCLPKSHDGPHKVLLTDVLAVMGIP